jgi:hypothetical protein
VWCSEINILIRLPYVSFPACTSYQTLTVVAYSPLTLASPRMLPAAPIARAQAYASCMGVERPVRPLCLPDTATSHPAKSLPKSALGDLVTVRRWAPCAPGWDFRDDSWR